MRNSIPAEVQKIANKLHEAGFQSFLVGGCLRDLVMHRQPKDWDVATDALPEEVNKLFVDFAGGTKEDPDTVYENDFGTVGIKTGSEDSTLKIIEVTTFRIEGKYSDARHPDEVKFAKSIEEDLARRDFTVNAMALDLAPSGPAELVDPFGGLTDMETRLLRAVGKPIERFREDALRMLRAVRFAADLDFQIDPETFTALRDEAGLLEMISKERIRDELQKMIMTSQAARGIVMLEDTGLLKFILPELREGIGCGQNKHHTYTVFDHNVHALGYAAEKNYPLAVRLSALLHDIGKPRTKAGDGPDCTFHGHEVVGARMAVKILDRLHFPKEVIERVGHLIRYHMFYYNVGEVSEAGVRRFLRRIGLEYLDDLLKVREADRIGSNVPKAFPYKLRHLLFMIDKVKRDPIHPKMLALDGNELMKILELKPSRKVGDILSVLLEEVLDDPARNTKEWLSEKAKELNLLSEKELGKLSEKAKETKDEAEEEVESDIKAKYHIK